MTLEQKQKLKSQLWKIANELRGNMNADEFRDYILGFVFFKYLSERQHQFAGKLLATEETKEYAQVVDEEDIEAISKLSLLELGYFLRPEELFSVIAAKGNASLETEDNFILDALKRILNNIEQSTMGTESEEDFNKLFEDIDLSNTKLGKSPGERNELIAKVLFHLDQIDFGIEESDSDILGDAYEYLIAQFASGAGKKAGEFYTPQQVSKVIAKIVTLDKGTPQECLRSHVRVGLIAPAGRKGSRKRQCRHVLWPGTEPHYIQPRPYEHDSARCAFRPVRYTSG